MEIVVFRIFSNVNRLRFIFYAFLYYPLICLIRFCRMYYRLMIMKRWKYWHHYLALVFVSFCFGFVSLFNGISTFVGYLMPKLSSWKNSNGIIYPFAERIRGFLPFIKVLVRKKT